MRTFRADTPSAVLPDRLELERFFDLSLDLLCLADREGFLVKVNPAFESVLGYPAEELVSRPFVELVHPDDRDRPELEYARVMAGEPAYLFENRYLCRNGTYRWLSWTAKIHPDDGMCYAIARDVTGMKMVEEELERSQSELERRVEERTRELRHANDRLASEIHERAEAEERSHQHLDDLARASRVSTAGQMTAGIAHQLNQPLAAIQNYASGCIRRLEGTFGDRPDVRDALERIVYEARRAAEVSRHLRDFVAKRRVASEPLQLNDVVAAVVDLVRPEMKMRDSAARSRCPKDCRQAGATGSRSSR